VQVDPIKPTLKAPGTKRLKPQHEKLLSKSAFNFYLCRYTVGVSRPSSHRPSSVAAGSYGGGAATARPTSAVNPRPHSAAGYGTARTATAGHYGGYQTTSGGGGAAAAAGAGAGAGAGQSTSGGSVPRSQGIQSPAMRDAVSRLHQGRALHLALQLDLTVCSWCIGAPAHDHRIFHPGLTKSEGVGGPGVHRRSCLGVWGLGFQP